MKKVYSLLIGSLFVMTAIADDIELTYTNHTANTSDRSTEKTINVMADIGDNVTFEIDNLSTTPGAWQFNRNPLTGANVNPYTFTVTEAGVYSVNTNSAYGTVYFYICVSNSARPLAPPPIIGSATNCADAVYPATSYRMEGLNTVLPYCVDSYTWIAPSGASVVTSNNGLEATVTFTSAFVGGSLRVRANTTTGVSKERTMFISCPNFNSRRLTAAVAEETAQVNVFPNPFAAHIKVTTNSSELFALHLSDITGKEVMHQSFTGSTTINTETLPEGIYFYELRNADGPLKRARIMKQ